MIFITLALVSVGTAFRFIALYAPFAAFCIVVFAIFIKRFMRNHILWGGLVALFVVGELWFSIQGIFVEFPHLGVVDLDRYLSTTLGSSQSFSSAIPVDNLHLNAIIQKNAAKLPEAIVKKMIVYDENIIISPRLWLFARRHYYHGIPAIPVREFKNIIRVRGTESLHGYEVYFVKATEKTAIINTLGITSDAQDLEGFLKNEFNLNPAALIYGLQLMPQGGFQSMPMFLVYKIIL